MNKAPVKNGTQNVAIPNRVHREIKTHADREGMKVRAVTVWAWETFKVATSEQKQKAKASIVHAAVA